MAGADFISAPNIPDLADIRPFMSSFGCKFRRSFDTMNPFLSGVFVLQ
jgi:hypothetical protein